jgi:hypothetical protein
MRFVAIETGAEATLHEALSDRFQLQADDGEAWCVAPGYDGRSVSSDPSGPFKLTPRSSSTDSTL